MDGIAVASTALAMRALRHAVKINSNPHLQYQIQIDNFQLGTVSDYSSEATIETWLTCTLSLDSYSFLYSQFHLYFLVLSKITGNTRHKHTLLYRINTATTKLQASQLK